MIECYLFRRDEKLTLSELVAEEKMVLDIVHEYLDKNRYLTTEKIIPFINSRFSKSKININSNGIVQILDSLIKKNHILEGSKLSKKDVLNNANRESIFNLIRKNPGTYLSRISKDLNLKKPITEWHLGMLLKFKCVKKIKINGHEAYFFINTKFENYKIIHYMQREKYRKVIEYLQNKKEGITKTSLSKELKMHPNTIKKYLNKLEEQGIVFKKKVSKKLLFFVDEKILSSIL